MPDQQKSVLGAVAREIEDQTTSNLEYGFEPSEFALRASNMIAETAYEVDRQQQPEPIEYPKYVVTSRDKDNTAFADMASAMLEAGERIDNFDMGTSIHRYDQPPILSTANDDGRIFEKTGVEQLFRHGQGWTETGKQERDTAVTALADEYLQKAHVVNTMSTTFTSERPLGAEMYAGQLAKIREQLEALTGEKYDIALRERAVEKVKNVGYDDAYNHGLWNQVRVQGHLEPIAGSVKSRGDDYIGQEANMEKLQSRIAGFIPNGDNPDALLVLEEVSSAYTAGFDRGIEARKVEVGQTLIDSRRVGEEVARGNRESLNGEPRLLLDETVNAKSKAEGLVSAKDVLPAIMADMRYAITEGISQIKTDNAEIAAALIANFNGQTAMYNTIAERLEKETGREYTRLETKPQLQQIMMQVEQEQEAKLVLNHSQQHSRGRSLQV